LFDATAFRGFGGDGGDGKDDDEERGRRECRRGRRRRRMQMCSRTLFAGVAPPESWNDMRRGQGEKRERRKRGGKLAYKVEKAKKQAESMGKVDRPESKRFLSSTFRLTDFGNVFF